jgi:L-cysteine S-thiosulfotransferase
MLSHHSTVALFRHSKAVCAPFLGCMLACSAALAQNADVALLADRQNGNCIACHAVPGVSGVASTFGPPLDKVGTRYDAATLRQWVTDARVLKADTLMPPFGTTQGLAMTPGPASALLTPGQIDRVVAALQSLR